MKTSQRTNQRLMTLIVACAVLVLWPLLLASQARGQDVSLTLATDRVGTTTNVIGSGMAKVVSQYSSLRIVVRPFAGPDAWLPAANQGELNLGALSSYSAWQAYHAKAEYKEPLANLRLLRSGSGSLLLSLVVADKSSIRSVKDLKGKRVSAGFGGHTVIGPSITAVLEAAGLRWSDVVQVPVVGAADGVQALMEGRLDASWASFGMPQVRQADARIGVRYLPLDSSPQGVEVMRRLTFPGLKVVTAKAGSGPGVVADTTMMTYDSYLIANARLSDESARVILTMLWDHEKELLEIHPGLRGFTNDAAVTSLPVLPYHPDAIRFYKAKGGWHPAAEEAQKKLTR